MSNEYPLDVRREARRLWLTGRFTDEEIAAKLRLPRADTIRDWRAAEGWHDLARDLSEVIRDEVKRDERKAQGAFRNKYDQLGQVLEARAVRALSDPNLPPRDLKAIAGTLAQSQKIRDKALGSEAAQKRDELDGTVAGLFLRAHEQRKERERGEALGRCRPDPQNEEAGAVEPDGDEIGDGGPQRP